MSSNNNDKEPVMHSNSNYVEMLINDKEDEDIKELFQYFLSRCQIELEISIKGSGFICSFQHVLLKIWVSVCFNTGKRFSLEIES